MALSSDDPSRRGARPGALPIALALGVAVLCATLIDVVSCTQILALGGADSLLFWYPVGGLLMAAQTVLLAPVIDRWPRLLMLRVLLLGIAAVLAGAAVLLVASQHWWGATAVPLIAAGLLWVLADVPNFLVPMLLWALAGDLFNAAQGKEVFPWIASWSYGGRVCALAVAVLSPVAMAAAGLDLAWLLVLPPLALAALGLWLPRRMRDCGAAAGLQRVETPRQALSGGWAFIAGIGVWRAIAVGSVVTYTAVHAIILGIAVASEELIGQSEVQLQIFLGGTQLAAILTCLGVQRHAAVPLARRLGIGGTLMVLPVAAVFAGMLLAASLIWSQLLLLAAAVLVLRVPLWSVDANARSAALALVPDQRRARVVLVLVLATYALTWVLTTPVAAPGMLSPATWLLGVLPAVVAVLGLRWWWRVARGWDDSLLDWRLRRRRHDDAGLG